ncbi:hypothetical protein F5Y16DRAFT_111832 [Xylariaceae sp. FL0255]|nr:hypothetical protein F5Y16DRAFT_111832 [Xylariaceae sp. FL0255]
MSNEGGYFSSRHFRQFSRLEHVGFFARRRQYDDNDEKQYVVGTTVAADEEDGLILRNRDGLLGGRTVPRVRLRPRKWRQGFAKMARVQSLQRVLILAVVVVALLFVLFEAHQREIIKVSPGSVFGKIKSTNPSEESDYDGVLEEPDVAIDQDAFEETVPSVTLTPVPEVPVKSSHATLSGGATPEQTATPEPVPAPEKVTPPEEPVNDKPPPNVNVAPDHEPGLCTTWPVGENGVYEPKRTSKTAADSLKLQSFAPRGGWTKPANVTVKGLIFYGRMRTVDILDCHLQQNLAANGGMLDEVWFLLHTDNQGDLKWLKELVEKRPQYKIIKSGDCVGFNYGCIWDPIIENDTIYVKIDDDIVFIHPDTIPQLVHTRIAEPHPFAISANLVNSPLTGYKHYDVGAIHPFLPDPENTASHPAAEIWRALDLPVFPSSQLPKINEGGKMIEVTEEVINTHIEGDLKYEGHPWLLLDTDVDSAMMKTPMGVNKLRGMQKGMGDAYGSAWHSWKVSAQQQYSLLRNLELDSMWRYHFGTLLDLPQGANSSADPAALKFFDPNHLGPGGEQLFDTNYVRYNLNFVALWGHDIRNNLPIANDDEEDLTVTIPRRHNRPFVIDTRAVVGHFSFYPQHDGIRRTDLLDRWRAYANEMVCPVDDLKKPKDMRCPGY